MILPTGFDVTWDKLQYIMIFFTDYSMSGVMQPNF